MLNEISQKLARNGYTVSQKNISAYLQEFDASQKHFPKIEQYVLMIRLLEEWKVRSLEKILILFSEYTIDSQFPIAISFGIISSDWPGLSDSCIGVIHEKGWNVYYTNGISLDFLHEKLGIVLVGILTETQQQYNALKNNLEQIREDIRKASVGNITKTHLLNEEIKKLQIYSSVIDDIESQYSESDIEKLIGVGGEAIKFFAARSRDYIANRETRDIARLIINNFVFQNNVRKYTELLQLDIQNFNTKSESEFTGISIGGLTGQISLDDLLHAMEVAQPGYQLKHHKDYSTEDGITIQRFEITTAAGHALNPEEIEHLKNTFQNLSLTKRRERQHWIDAIGGFEHYARAIIPFLIKESQTTRQNQVYLSALQTNEKLIDFKILIVLLPQAGNTNKLLYQCVNHLDSISGFYISKVKPLSRRGESEIAILDLQVDLTLNPELESIYKKVRKIMEDSFGKFRDFDEGVRQMDLRNFQNVRKQLPHVKESTLRELYYSLEDFYRIGAPVEEIAAQIKLGLELQSKILAEDKSLHILSKNVMQDDNYSPASIVVISFPSEISLLGKIFNLFGDYEVILSKFDKNDREMLICRISKNRRALEPAELQELVDRLKTLH